MLFGIINTGTIYTAASAMLNDFLDFMYTFIFIPLSFLFSFLIFSEFLFPFK